MKSKKAGEAIERYRRHVAGKIPSKAIAEYCRLFGELAEIAEQEAEERVREELTRWRDPEEELPEPYKVVEVKYRSSGLIHISTVWMSAGGCNWTIDRTNHTINQAKVIGWREIYE